MKQKMIALLLALGLALSLTACGGLYEGDDVPDSPAGAVTDEGGAPASVPDGGQDQTESGGTSVPPEMPDQFPEDLPALDEDGTYNTRDEVALYLWTYGHLPDNYITKSEARDLGWTGGSVEQVAPGYAIGGDRFGNREGLLPQEYDYRECDVDTIGQDSRGAQRLVYTEDCACIYYTGDHYESFTLLYGEE